MSPNRDGRAPRTPIGRGARGHIDCISRSAGRRTAPGRGFRSRSAPSHPDRKGIRMTSRKLAIAVAAVLAVGSAYAQSQSPSSQSQSPSSQSPSSSSQSQPSSSNELNSSNGASASSNGASAKGDESVRQQQQQLKSQGCDPGPVDGILGPKTQAAID